MTEPVAILYDPDGYTTSGPRLLGRQAAGEGFLKGLVEHGTAPNLYCYAQTRKAFEDFTQRIRPWAKRQLQVTWLQSADGEALSTPGLVYRPDCVLGPLVWQRRYAKQRNYSVCGITHTIATRGTMESLGNLLLAPVQPWDALICTSQAVRTAVDQIHQSYGEYLRSRLGGTPHAPLKLPVIPLGIDCSQFAPSSQTAAARSTFRAALGIKPNDVVVLYIGRLIFYAKAHPAPMYMALERAARQSGRTLHLIQAGWFESPHEEEQFKAGAAALCPSVRCIFVDGRKPDVRLNVWSSADIFMSLADNVQETFGITPIEAMAAGLPAIVSDWNGYKESVREGIDGFKIPTLTPPPGSGVDWAAAYCADGINYSAFVAHPALASAVDIDAAVVALTRLIENPELRRTLGDQGRARAHAVYDWKVIIGAYESLWQELAELRKSGEESCAPKPGEIPNPLCDDPLRLFGHYPTGVLSAESSLVPGAPLPEATQRFLRTHPLTHFGSELRAPEAFVDHVLARVKDTGSLSVSSLLKQYPKVPATVLMRTLVHLVKFGFLRATGLSPAGTLTTAPEACDKANHGS